MNVEQEFNSLFVKDAGTINATLLNAPSTILGWIQENFTPKVSQVEKPVMQPKIYVVEGYDSLAGGDEIKGVFSTKEKAQKWMNENNYCGEPSEYEVA